MIRDRNERGRLTMKKRAKSIIVVGVIMLIYSLWLCIGSLFLSGMWPRFLLFSRIHSFYQYLHPILRLSLTFRQPIFCYHRGSLTWHYYLSLPLLFGGGLVGLIYLISSINILRFKNWGRVLGVYFSALILLSLTVKFICGIIIEPEILAPGNFLYGFPFVLFAIIIPFILPSLLFLFFFTRPKVKEQFKK